LAQSGGRTAGTYRAVSPGLPVAACRSHPVLHASPAVMKRTSMGQLTTPPAEGECTMTLARATGVVVGAIVLMADTAGLNRARLQRAHAGLASGLLAQSEPQTSEAFCPEMMAGLPVPVQRYLTRVIREGQPMVTTVRLRQTGKFRPGGRTSPWKSFSAAQTFTIPLPGSVWDATIAIAPLMSATVTNRYQDGAGALEARMMATFTVASAAGEPELTSGELMGYLVEAVWFPTTLLINRGVGCPPRHAQCPGHRRAQWDPRHPHLFLRRR